ncbi:MAG: arsenite methyltransferase [Actinomycetota bacterium]
MSARQGEAALREEVRRRYAASAMAVGSGCCGADTGCGPAKPDQEEDDMTGGLYSSTELAEIPTGAADGSLGCGNPTAVTELREGESVLDLGSGGGIDVLLSARRVGPTGHVYGLDMTEEMLDLARRNAVEAGTSNVEFLKGYIEDIPLADASVDVIISNCVINLSADKPAVFADMHRVLRREGRIGISDIVADDRLSADQRAERGSWVGCIAGALSMTEYRAGLAGAGFADISFTPTHEVAEGLHSMIIRAVKR